MQFPNALKGIKKVYASIIMEIIGAVCLILGAFAAMLGMMLMEQNEEQTSLVIGLISVGAVVISGILTLAAGVLSIVGFLQASKDEGSFKIAIIVSIASIVLGILLAIFYDHVVLRNILSQIVDLLGLVVTIYVIQGIINLAESIGDKLMIKRGKTLFIMITIVYGLTCLANIIAAIFGEGTASVIASVIALLAELFGGVQLIIYIVFLAKAKKMLRNN